MIIFSRCRIGLPDYCIPQSDEPERMEELMLNTGMLTKDLGTILVGHQAVEEGIINEVGGISDAVQRLHFMINESCI